MRAFGYLRISNDPHGTSISPERQKAEIGRCAQAKGFDVVEWFEDRDRSAYRKVARPGFEQMLTRLDEIDAVFVYELSRAARRMAVAMSLLDTLEEQGKRLVSVTQGDTGEGQRFVFDVLFAADANESRRIGERVRSAKKHLAATGQLPFRARAFGWTRDADGEWAQVPEEVEVIRRMVTSYLGGLSLMLIAEGLNADGITTYRGKDWSAQAVGFVLDSPRLGGFFHLHGKPTTETPRLEPILDTETWNLLRAERHRRTRKAIRTPRTDTELSGLLHCELCDGRLYHQIWPGYRPASYCCRKISGHSTCVQKAWVEQAIAEMLFERVDQKRLDEIEGELEGSDPNRELRATITQLEWGRDELMRDFYQERRLERDAFDVQIAEIEDRLTVLREKMVQDGHGRAQAGFVRGLAGLKELWPYMTTNERRVVFSAAIERVVVKRVTDQSMRLNPVRLQVAWLVP